jgi:DNA topoisomerase-1
MAPRATPNDSARSAGLAYVLPGEAGLSRVRRGSTLVYLDAEGRPVRDEATLARIRSLVIPPAWTHVWICANAEGHIQAMGRDARGRKQYRYHPRWREVRDDAKFHRMIAFGHALPRIRRHLQKDLRRPGLKREKVIAAVVRLLERTQIRVGNEEYARANRSFGLTTLRSRHAEVRGTRLVFTFRGKSGKMHEVRLRDKGLARIVRRCQALPGRALFQYMDGRRRKPVASEDVNAYLRETSGSDFTAKDFRTWAATVRAAWELFVCPPAASAKEGTRTAARAVANVARRLGNTPTICRKSYIHPAVLTAYLDGSLHPGLELAGSLPGRDGLSGAENAVLTFLEEATAPGAADERLESALRRSVAARRAKGPARPSRPAQD